MVRPKIGVVASESSESSARVILVDGMEKKVRAEDVVLIRNKNGPDVIGVLRKGTGLNEALKLGGYRPGVAYAKAGGEVSKARETYDYRVAVIGAVGERVEQNKSIISPGSEVELFTDEDNPMDMIAKGVEKLAWIGHYEGHESWRIPVDVSFIPYHIGIFATTGGGKSFLARHVIIPLLSEAGYAVIVFDWKGRDYAPFFDSKLVIGLEGLALDEEVVIQYIAEKAKFFGYSGEYALRNPIIDALEDFLFQQSWRGKSPQEFRHMIEENMYESLKNDKRAHLRFSRYWRRITDDDLKSVLGDKKPEDLIKMAKSNGILILDMKKAGAEQKLSIFLSVANYLKERMENDEEVNLALVIDEGPQYAPFKPQGIQSAATEMIKNLCALGRSYKLCIVILAQAISGDIGINAAVRRNLNTQFFGRIHPLDMEEAQKWLEPYGIGTDFLLSLPPGRFYFAGIMNPSPVPLLMSFKIGD
ncbi:MAG: DUF87 domain-containing protein [Nitrososphaerota archaeon]|nr:DUF87 domain-containing protein [Nitrososphaerota archaeon]